MVPPLLKKTAMMALFCCVAYVIVTLLSFDRHGSRLLNPSFLRTLNGGESSGSAPTNHHHQAQPSGNGPAPVTAGPSESDTGALSDRGISLNGKDTPETVTRPPLKGPPNTTSPLKYILFWNEFYGSMEFMWGSGQKPFIDNGCEVNTCFGTNNRTFMDMDKYDAILLHAQTVALFGWPNVRAPHQRYVFVTMESAQYLTIPLSSDKYRDAFNLTLTYRLDSDFPYRYGAMEPVPSPPPTSTRNYAAGKSKLVAWFVSHCSSKSNRGKYVRLLQKHIPVDIYGQCGPFKCPRSENNTCHQTLLNNDYKFYLSFENSICNDYVTEKLFDALKFDVVPVVLGGANYSSFAPPGSYIDALQYTPEELAKYLLKLDKDDAAYNAFFQWKGKYRPVEKATFQRSAFCDLCKYLHTDKRKVYNRMQDWWVKGQCERLEL